MDTDDPLFEHLCGEDFDAAAAYSILIAELIVELVQSGALSEDAVVDILMRNESFIDQLPHRTLLGAAHHRLLEHVEQRLALRPQIFSRRFRGRKKT